MYVIFILSKYLLYRNLFFRARETDYTRIAIRDLNFRFYNAVSQFQGNQLLMQILLYFCEITIITEHYAKRGYTDKKIKDPL